MKIAKDYRDSAWNILRGRYWWTVLAGLIASLLGGVSGRNVYRFDFNYNDISNRVSRWTGWNIDSEQLTSFVRPFAGIFVALGSLVLVYGIVMFIIGSVVELGFNRFTLSLYQDKSVPKIDLLFSRFSIFGNALLLRVLMVLKTLAWTLLFIVPGIIAAFRYSMAPYIMAENPDITPMEAIEQSKQLMANNKWRLFCLQFSFIGWWILASLTGGIGAVFLIPYTHSAITAFYLDLTGRLPQTVYEYTAPAASSAGASSGEGDASTKELI